VRRAGSPPRSGFARARRPTRGETAPEHVTRLAHEPPHAQRELPRNSDRATASATLASASPFICSEVFIRQRAAPKGCRRLLGWQAAAGAGNRSFRYAGATTSAVNGSGSSSPVLNLERRETRLDPVRRGRCGPPHPGLVSGLWAANQVSSGKVRPARLCDPLSGTAVSPARALRAAPFRRERVGRMRAARPIAIGPTGRPNPPFGPFTHRPCSVMIHLNGSLVPQVRRLQGAGCRCL